MTNGATLVKGTRFGGSDAEIYVYLGWDFTLMAKNLKGVNDRNCCFISEFEY